MANVSSWIFFNEESTEQVSNYLANPSNAGSITIQVEKLGSGEINLAVEGMNDLNSPDAYFPMKCISLEDFKTYSTITKPGLYMTNFCGVQRLRMVSNTAVGGFRAFGIAVE